MINALSSVIPNTVFSQVSGMISTLFYPLDIATTAEKNSYGIDIARPIIVFSCGGRTLNGPKQYIAFPIPQGLEFSDGASYDDAALGITGAAIAGAIRTSENAMDRIASLGAEGAIDSVVSQFTNAASNVGVASAAFTAASNLGGESIKSAVGISMKMAVNRHVITEFTGVGTRSYGFKFKLIGSSPDESRRIKDIANAFRNGLYPEADILALKYPPTWNISFMHGNAPIEFLPKIWTCYLTSLNVSYNGSTNLWHTDGSPVECDITVSFKETRTLSHQDIQALDEFNSVDAIPNSVKNNNVLLPEYENNQSSNNQ